jgi:hypothetical protein
VRRYQDKNSGLGHAEVGQWVLGKIAGLMSPHVIRLARYAILAHTHVLKPQRVKFPAAYERLPVWDDLWQEGDRYYGLAIRIARMADRLDTNALSQVWRHILSRCDSREEGGADISGGEWVTLNKESFTAMFHPYVRPAGGNPPTVFEHVLRYRGSNWGNSVYSASDHLFAGYGEAMTQRYAAFDRSLASMDDISSGQLKGKDIIRAMQTFSCSGNSVFEPVGKLLGYSLDELNPEDQARWGRFLSNSWNEYETMLKDYRQLLESGFPDTARLALSLLMGKKLLDI